MRALDIDRFEKSALLADVSRLNTLYMIMRAGSGHIGSSFSAMDIVSWLYNEELKLEAQGKRRPDVYFSSKGHDAPGLYAHLITAGLYPFERIHTLRRLGGLPGHPDVEQPLLEANTGSLGMGISKAKGMIHAARLNGEVQRCFILTGDGELQEGQFWESLTSAANYKMGELVAIVDHNKMQSDTWCDYVSAHGDLEAKFRSYGWEVARCDGNDAKALAEVLAQFEKVADKPKILLADTVKGRGVSFMEHNNNPGKRWEQYMYHSGAPTQDDFDNGVAELLERINGVLQSNGQEPVVLVEEEQPDRPPKVGQKLIAAYSEAVLEQAKKNPDLVCLDGDLVLDTGLIPFMQQYPERFIECGIAEMDMVSQAGGLALKGKLPACHSFGCFMTPRANEQIYNNATERTKVIYAGSLVGLCPAGPGHSHQSVRDIAILAQIPGMVLFEPCNEAELKQGVDLLYSDKVKESVYLRLITIPVETNYELAADYQVQRGKGTVLRDGSDVVIFGYGPLLLSEACKAADSLGDATSVKVVNLPWLNEVDDQWLKETLGNASRVITLDNHYLSGGQGEFLTARMAEKGFLEGRSVKRLGVTDVPKCGTNPEVLAAHKLDADSIAAVIKS